MERKPEVPASPRGEALFRCARPSGIPRGPANSTGSLASQRHPGKFPKVPVHLGLSLVAAGRDYSLVRVPGLVMVASLAAEHGLESIPARRFKDPWVL